MNHMLVVIPFDLPWEHTADYAHQTARVLAKTNTVVCYMQKEAKSVKEYFLHPDTPLFWRKHASNLFLYYPLYGIPFRRFPFVEQANTFLNILFLKLCISVWLRRYTFNRKILWLFYPEYVFMVRVFGSTYSSLYDCVDYHIGSSPYQERRDNIVRWEKELISACRYFFVNSQTLYAFHKKQRKDIVLVPQGFRIDEFKKPTTSIHVHIPSDKPVIGYVGGINFRLDYGLLLHCIRNTPQYTYVFAGPVQENDPDYFQKHVKHNIDTLFSLPNVYHIEAVSKDMIPSVISLFDIAMIPYDAHAKFNAYCYPMKLFEYFYMGKPTVSTPIHELTRFPRFVRIGKTAKEWERHITQLLSLPWPASYQKEQKCFAAENSWEKKIQMIVSRL